MSGVHVLAIAMTFLGLFVGLFATVCCVAIVADAFRTGGAGPGLAAAFTCGAYALYWGIAKMTHPRKWVLLSGWIGGGLLAVALLFWAGALRAAAGPLPTMPEPPVTAPPG